ncbi:hypothetical protein DID88_002345 [Monilinia fructigena]|uniref:Uncharacterized protein n=1 Tax=Monilinia fructigena TaxID=38457 RepID=A0A395ICV0_9HELO|nr:hypothetical protein DID88_002345 [Monilinia fructigena]
MCLCSDIQYGFTQSSDNQEFVGRLEAFLTQLYTYISSNEQLMPHLPFILQKRTASVSSTASEPLQVEKEKRIAKIYKYDPADYHVQTLLHRNFDIWDKQPQSFFVYQQAQLTYETIDPQSAIILNCLQLQQIDTHSRILRRFYCVALYRCRKAERRNDDAKSMARTIFPIYHSGKSLEEAGDDMQSLVKTIETLLQAGPRYENIAEKLGFGSLFLLGDMIPIGVWEKWLPRKGPLLDQAMKYLMDKGIIDLGKKYEKLAEKIINVFKRFEDIVVQQPSKRKPSHQLGGRKKRNRNDTTKDILDSSGCGTEAEPTALDHTIEFADQLGANSPGNRACNFASDRFRQDPGTSTTICARAPDADPATSISNPISIHALLNADITTSIHGQQLSSQAKGARQLIGAVEEHTADDRIQATNDQREIEFVYSNRQKENLEINLEEPFRSPIMARLQPGLENHRQDIIAMFPQDWEQDATFSMTVDRETGSKLLHIFDLQRQPQVQFAQGQIHQYSEMPMENLSCLGPSLHQATVGSEKYKSALRSGCARCTCVSAFISGGTDDNDITFSIMVDQKSGLRLRDSFGLHEIEKGF